MKSSRLSREPACRVKRFVFSGESNITEANFTIQTSNQGSFQEQLEELEFAYREALVLAGLERSSAVFRRFFLSDCANQEAQLRASDLARSTESDPVAVSVIEQQPLPASKLALWAYHIEDPEADLVKSRTDTGIALRRGGLEHLWSTRLCLSSDGLEQDIASQTRAAFSAYCDELATRGSTLRDHVLRTWIFVPSIDRDYSAMTAERRELFLAEGLRSDTHYLASTGIAGRTAECRQGMILEGYAVAGIQSGQIRYLEAPDHLGPTQAYGVTFERGVSIQYGDRRHVLISGTASIDPQGRICYLRDVLAQTRRAFANVKALLSEAGCGFEDIAQMIVYLRDPSDQPAVQAWLEERHPDTPCVLVHAPVCRPGWLIEVECSAIVESNDPRWPAF